MKKNILLTSLAVAIIFACTIFISDGLTYLVSALMALAIIGGIKANKKWVMKMTRWAKANPKNAQVYISVIQIALLLLAIITGYNLKELGYEFSNITAYIFTAIMVLGFAYVPFLPKRNTIAIPKQVDRNRFAFMSIALSSVILMAFTGNRIGEVYPDSLVTQALEKIDQTIFPEDISTTIDLDNTQIGAVQNKNFKGYLLAASAKPLLAAVDVRPKENINDSSDSKRSSYKKSKKSRKEIRRANRKARKELRKLKRNRKTNLRRAASGGACAGAILLIILLLAPLCAGICLIIGAWGNTGALSILAGVALTGLSVWGIIEAGKLCSNNRGSRTLRD